ncbi:MAG: DAK2 domain-containing protein [Clostridia bacterium]|nr:DAK2 domain-containing protein [Clostridia bacterium]
MNVQTVDGELLRSMFLGGAANLELNRAYVDSLNVFPVPDGDTGTNMSMTMQGAVKELNNVPQGASVSTVMDAVSIGALKNARGNSGVILSQLFRGFSVSLKGASSFDAAAFVAALEAGSAKAYKAVMRPKEGTILTVSRMIAEDCRAALDENPDLRFDQIMEKVLQYGDEALKKTPDLLPVLKEAGVVDSGGMGLMMVYRGFMAVLNGEDIGAASDVEPKQEETYLGEQQGEAANLEVFDTDSIEFGYCSEFFIIHLKEGFSERDLEQIRDFYNRLGDSLVLAPGDDFVKIHVHSNAPGDVLRFALQYGELDKIKIENMREQNRQLLNERAKNEREYALLAVSAGIGIDEVFHSIGVEQLISGGQTMNPSIDTIVNAVRACNARNVFVLPNNSNIILAAEQAKELCSCNVVVLHTKTIPQGITAAMAFNPDASLEENTESMEDAISLVVSGAVTYAIRDTSINGNQIHEGDIIGLMDNKIVSVHTGVADTVEDLLEQMVEKSGIDEPIVNLYYGDQVSAEQAEELCTNLSEARPEAEFILTPGEQPLYYYYLSVE